MAETIKDTKFGQWAQVSVQHAYLNTIFGLNLAMKKFNVSETELERVVGRYGSKSKYNGTLKCYLTWFRVDKPGFCPTGYRDPEDPNSKVPGFVIKEKDATFGYRIQDYDCNILIGVDFSKRGRGGVIENDWKDYYREYKKTGDNVFVVNSDEDQKAIDAIRSLGISEPFIAKMLTNCVYSHLTVVQYLKYYYTNPEPYTFIHLVCYKKYKIEKHIETLLPLLEKLVHSYKKAGQKHFLKSFVSSFETKQDEIERELSDYISTKLSFIPRADIKYVLDSFLYDENIPDEFECIEYKFNWYHKRLCPEKNLKTLLSIKKDILNQITKSL
jgi:hypothetical protein